MNKVLSNFHTHTTYCDGKNTPREMVEAAIQRGFRRLGFSGHAYSVLGEDFCIARDRMERYRQEIMMLKSAYADRIELFVGLEVEAIDPYPANGYDYTIGSVHYFKYGDNILAVDNQASMIQEAVDTLLGGDMDEYARLYYEEVARAARTMRPDIIGHFDVLTKFNEKYPTFNTESAHYRDAAYDALEGVVKAGCIVEINTGAMANGNRTSPYPEAFILKRLHELGGRIMINADAHRAEWIDFALNDAAALARAQGFRERMELTADGFRAVPL